MTFRLKPAYMHIDVPREVMPYDDGDDPLRVKIRINLSLAEIDALTVKKATGLVAWSDLYDAFAPHVIEWNLDVPAPAEGGPEMFAHLPADGFSWIAQQIKTENYRIRHTASTPSSAAIHAVPSKKHQA